MHAAEYGHINALQLLRDAKANPKIQDLEGRGAVSSEFENRHVLVDCLLDATFYCFTEPTNRHKACLRMLLEMGADVNNRSRTGVPNLVHACMNSKEQEEFCIDLIRAGADVRLVDEVRTRVHSFPLRNENVRRRQNERLCTKRAFPAAVMWCESCFAPRLTQTLSITSNPHRFTRQLKVVISR